MAKPKVRFRKDDGSSYPPIEPKLLNEFLTVNPDRNKDRKYDKSDVLSVSGDFGVVNQIEFQGRSFAGADVKDYHILYHGDVVYTKSPLKENPFGIVKYNDGPTGIVSTLYAVYHCKDNVDGRIIEYYFDLKSRLNNYLKPLVNIGAKHDMKISAEKAISDYVMIPSLEEQQKIADFLSSVDDVISTSEQEVANLETQKKAVMKKIFSQEVRFRRVDGTDFPEWQEARFGDTVTIERGGSPRPIESYITEGDGLNWVKIGDAPKYGNYITSTAQRIIPEGLRKTRQVFVGDLILSNSMSFGKPYIMGIDGCIHDGWLLIRNDQELYDLMYLCFLLGSDYMLKQYKSLAGGSAVNNLNKDLVAGTIVFIPSLVEQRLIADFLSDFDEAIAAAKKELELWKELKKGLLQQMFV